MQFAQLAEKMQNLQLNNYFIEYIIIHKMKGGKTVFQS